MALISSSERKHDSVTGIIKNYSREPIIIDSKWDGKLHLNTVIKVADTQRMTLLLGINVIKNEEEMSLDSFLGNSSHLG